MAISTNGTVIARLAGGLYNTVLSNATYLEVATQDPSTLANTLYSRDFAKSTDLSVATTLLANLGLSAEAGLDAWVAAQLTAAGAANKGAKIVSLLNDFAGLTADAKWGTYATAFNTKVDAALAASQKDAAVTGVFAAAGSVAVANATFALTSGVDGLDKFTGGAGNDTYTANSAALGTLDSIDGGTGTDTLAITDTADIPLLNITATGIETINATSSLGSVGAVGSEAKLAVKQVAVYDVAGLSFASSGTYTLNVGGVLKSVTVNSGTGNGTTATNMAAAIEAVLDEGIGAATWTAVTGTTVVTVTSNTAGTALPSITWSKQSADTAGTLITTSATYQPTASQVANQATAAAVAASTFTLPAGVTSSTIKAATTAKVASVSTAATDVTGTDVTVSGGASQTVAATGTVYASGSTGAVVVNNSQVSNTTSAGLYVAATTSGTGTGVVGGFGTSSSVTAKGVLVTGGSTVNVTNKAATITSGSPSNTNSNLTQVGSSANVSSSGSLTGTETIRNKAMSPTGDVTISTISKYTNTAGFSDVTYGAGAAKVYANGGSTVSVTGSNAVTIVDINSTNLIPSTGVTAVPGVSKLATVNLTGLSGSTTHSITSDAITTVSLSDTQTAETISILNSGAVGANSGAINFNVSNVGASTSTRAILSDATATTVNVGSAAASGTQQVGGSNINSASKSWITLTAAKATTVNMNNSLSVDIGNVVTTSAKVGVINGAGATGSIATTIGAATEYGMAFTGGSGADTVTLTGDPSVTSTTKATTVGLGAGNDSLLNSSATTTFTGASFDGGEGVDTVAISLLTVGNASKFTNFETLGLDASSGPRDVTILSGITGFKLLSNTAIGGGLTYTGATQSQSLTIGASMTHAAGITAIDFGSTVTGTADAYTITFGGSGATTSTATSPTEIQAGVVTVTGIENITLVSGGANYTNNKIALSDVNARTLTITGSQATGVTIDPNSTLGTDGSSTSSAGISSIDASALTGKLTLNTTNIKTAFAGVTVKGGTNDDSITITAQSAGLGRFTVDAGTGNDTIIVGTAAATLTGGTGNDIFDATLAVAGSAFATSPVFTTVTDFTAGDSIKMGTTTAVTAGKTLITTATSLTGALDAALKGSSSVPGVPVWFTYGGDTYVAVDVDTDGLSTNDIIVKLVGVSSDVAWTSTGSGLIGAA